MIYVGSFSKTLFPALRLGFLIVPPDLRDGLVAARAAADQHPPTLDQAVLADFIVDGHFARHLRRMRVVYQERLEALIAAAERCCGGVLRVRPVQTGLHALADLEGVDAARVVKEAAARGVEVAPAAAYCATAPRRTRWSWASAPSVPMRRGGAWSGWRRDRGRAASLTGRVGRLTLGPRNQGGVDGQGRVPDHGQ